MVEGEKEKKKKRREKGGEGEGGEERAERERGGREEWNTINRLVYSCLPTTTAGYPHTPLNIPPLCIVISNFPISYTISSSPLSSLLCLIPFPLPSYLASQVSPTYKHQTQIGESRKSAFEVFLVDFHHDIPVAKPSLFSLPILTPQSNCCRPVPAHT